MSTLIGRRVGSIDDIKKPGDYCGPLMGYTGPSPAVFFKLPEPLAGDEDAIHHVTSPPHTFRECEDGSLEIRNSILTRRRHIDVQWHGYLDEGHIWRTT